MLPECARNMQSILEGHGALTSFLLLSYVVCRSSIGKQDRQDIIRRQDATQLGHSPPVLYRQSPTGR